jgi:hypothetical protein
MKTDQPPGATAGPSVNRLPLYRASRLDEVPYWLLSVATFCTVVIFFSSITRFAANADRFAARLQEAPLFTVQPAYAGSALETNRPDQRHLRASSPAPLPPTSAIGVRTPGAAPQARSAI